MEKAGAAARGSLALLSRLWLAAGARTAGRQRNAMAARRRAAAACLLLAAAVQWLLSLASAPQLPLDVAVNDNTTTFVDSLLARRRVARIAGLPALEPLDFDRYDTTFESHESLGESTLVYWAASVRSNQGAAMRALVASNDGSPADARAAALPLRTVRTNPAKLLAIGSKQRERFARTRDASLLRYRYAGVEPASVLSAEEVADALQFINASDGAVTALWFASCGTAAQLHYDASDNIFRQLRGTKRFRLLSPASNAAAELFSTFSPAQRQSRRQHQRMAPAAAAAVDADAGALALGQQVDSEMVLTVDLEPGQALFIPAFTFHHVSTPVDTPLAVGLSAHWPSRSEGVKDAILSSPVPFDEPQAGETWRVGDAAAVFVTVLAEDLVSAELYARRRRRATFPDAGASESASGSTASLAFLRGVHARIEAGEQVPLQAPAAAAEATAAAAAVKMCREISPEVLTWRAAEAQRQRSRSSFRALIAQFEELTGPDASSCRGNGGGGCGGVCGGDGAGEQCEDTGTGSGALADQQPSTASGRGSRSRQQQEDADEVVEEEEEEEEHIDTRMANQAVVEIVLAELVELVSLWAAGVAEAHAQADAQSVRTADGQAADVAASSGSGSDGVVAAEFLRDCVLAPLAGGL